MALWKLQSIEPDTCDPTGCKYWEWWDAEVAPEVRQHFHGGFERVCPAHADPDIEVGILLSPWDGNWRDAKAFIEYQRAFFRRRNHVEWLARGITDAMPPQIASYTSDPVSPGSIPVPPQARRDALARGYQRNKDHNVRKNQILDAIKVERSDINEERITRRWEGTGDARVLYIHSGGQLSAQQRNRLQNLANIQFGAGKLVIEG